MALVYSESIVIQRKIQLKLLLRKQNASLVLLVHNKALWEADPNLKSWLKPSKHGAEFATRTCMRVSLGGKKDLQCHSERDVHKKAVE